MGYTRNWDNFKVICMGADNDTGTTGYADGSLQMKNTAGTVATDTDILQIGSYSYRCLIAFAHPTSTAVASTAKLATNSLGAGVALLAGSGTGDESYDDYAITDFADQVHVSYSYSANPVYNATTDKWTYTVTRILTNNSGSAITVGELALIGATLNNQAKNYVFYRKKLATPFEVAHGANYSISLDFEYQAHAH